MLKVQKVSRTAAVQAHRLTGHLVGRGLGDQLRRAAASVALNVAEGLSFDGKRERTHLQYAHGSCQEAKVATQILAEAGLVDLDAARELWCTLHSAGGLLHGLIRRHGV